MAADNSGIKRPDTKWNSFSKYADIAEDVHDSVSTAIEAQSQLDAMHREGARVSPEFAAFTRASIMTAVQKLLTELQNEEEDEDIYAEILDRWLGKNGDAGFIQQLADSRLSEDPPGFLHQFVRDIHTAAWELGYLRAGREEKQALEDKVEDDAQGMFDDI